MRDSGDVQTLLSPLLEKERNLVVDLSTFLLLETRRPTAVVFKVKLSPLWDFNSLDAPSSFLLFLFDSLISLNLYFFLSKQEHNSRAAKCISITLCSL